MKHERDKAIYIEECTRKEGKEIIVTSLKAEVWKLSGVRRGFERGSCPL
jgi:hypothetical protein